MSLSKREAESPSAEAPWGEADDQRLREAWAEGHSIIGSILIFGIYPMAAIPRLFQRPPLPPQSLAHIAAFMSSKFLDVSPPIHRVVKDELNRDLFKKSVPVLAAKVSPARTGAILKAEAMRRSDGTLFPPHHPDTYYTVDLLSTCQKSRAWSLNQMVAVWSS